MKPDLVSLGNLIEEVKQRIGTERKTVYSVTNDRGFIPSLDVFDKQVFSADISNYKLVRFNELAYNPSRINVGSIAICPDKNGGAVSPMYTIVRCNDKLMPRYLLYFLKSEKGRQEINHRAEGAVRFQLKFKDLQRISIYLPSLAEQERIVNLLDEAEALRTARLQTSTRMADFVPALFSKKFLNKEKNNWESAALGDICFLIRDGTHKTPTYVSEGIPFITVKNIVTGTLDFSKTKFITESEHNELTKRAKPELGDVLISKDGTIGVPCIVDTNKDFSIFVSVMLLKLKKDKIDPNFLVHQINSEIIQSQIKDSTKGIAIRHLHLEDARKIKVILPPLTLQQEFTQEANEVRAIQAVQTQSEERIEALYQSMLSRAFTGQL